RGVRDGLLLTMIDNTLGAPSTDPVNREAAIDRFASACSGEYELAHGKQVAKLAGRIFEQIAERFELNPEDRPLLETAARLQDVGYLINYDQHHKHSYHLILNSRLPGFRPRELELIANVARYHRGARPKMKHANFRQLSREDRLRVERLAAVLRLAGGLDRSHSQQVKDVTLRTSDESRDHLELLVHADLNPEVDLWGARRRLKMFCKVFGVKLSINWNGLPENAVSETNGVQAGGLIARSQIGTVPAIEQHERAGVGSNGAETRANGKSRNGAARKPRRGK
ncbi:MAG TPA: hypothetical protein VGI75_15110, partial [Pirellulales bacterium]